MHLVATEPWGLAVSYDSVAYMQASDDLVVEIPQPRDQGGEPLYWWAPGYPLALRAAGGDLAGARVVNAILLAAGTLVVGAVAWRALGPTAGAIAGGLYGLSPVVFATHLEALAEPLYLVLATAVLGLLAERRPGWAGLLAGAAVLTRYAGLPLLATGALVLRGRDRLVFLAVGGGLYGAWLVRNVLSAGETTGREPRWHPPGWDAAEAGASTVMRLLLTPGELGSVELPLLDAGLLLQLAVAAALAVALVRWERRGPWPPLVKIGLLYAALYCLFLAATLFIFDAVTPVDERLLVPLVPPLAFVLAWVLRRQPAVAAVVCGLLAVAVLQEARTFRLYGLGYSGRIFAEASVTEAAAPPGALASNWPGLLAYFTGRSATGLPRGYEADTLDPNASYTRQLARLAADVRARRRSLVLFDERRFPRNGPAVASLRAELGRACRPLTGAVTVCSSVDPEGR